MCTAAPGEAVAQSLAALEWLKRQGCRQFLFKYCSTFDSTQQGNIGPVLDALSTALPAARVAVCPVFPATGRTLFQGHLLVGDRLLSESGMENHPLTPMRDADIRRWLGHQTARGIGHVPHDVMARGAAAIDHAMAAQAASGRPYVVVDALSDAHLMSIGGAIARCRSTSRCCGSARCRAALCGLRAAPLSSQSPAPMIATGYPGECGRGAASP